MFNCVRTVRKYVVAYESEFIHSKFVPMNIEFSNNNN